MGSPSHAEITLLALLQEGPAHAYELVDRIQSMRVDQWARVPESTVYSVLRRMQDRGWVQGRKEPGQRGRSRVVYRRTAEGERHLADLLARGLEDPDPIYSDVLVAGVFAAGTGHMAPLENGLERLAAQHARLTEVRGAAGLSDPGRAILDFYLGIVDLQRTLLRSLTTAGRTTPSPTLRTTPAPPVPDVP